jgi:hypothetical protein
MSWATGVQFLASEGIIFFTTMLRLTLGPNWFPGQCVTNTFSMEVKADGT